MMWGEVRREEAGQAAGQVAELAGDVRLQEVAGLDAASRAVLRAELAGAGVGALLLQAVLERAQERANTGAWRLVPPCTRKTITIASYLKLLAFLTSNESNHLEEEVMKEALEIVDHGLIFGCQLDNAPQLLQNCATILNKVRMKSYNCDAAKLLNTGYQSNSDIDEDIAKLNCPSMEHFYANYIAKETPAVLTNCINDWPALSKWQDINYLLKLGGLRTVPVELGSKYTDSEWTQKLMTLEEFINSYVLQKNNTKGYLAQYQLFEQIPELRSDIKEPEYCCFAECDEVTDINAWFGPKGTVSPLHYDPKKNLLAQVVGEKKIILFSPQDSEYLYPHDDELLFNTARVDLQKPDLAQYPKFKQAKPYRCVLKPGEMIYIPPKWWHFVESTSVSFSVSFWWN